MLITLFACAVSVGDINYLRTGKHLFCNWSSSCLSFIFPPFNPKASQASKKGHAAPFCGKLFPSTHSAFYVQSIKQQRFTRTVDIPAPSGALAAWQTDRYSLLSRACLAPCASAVPSAHLLTPRDDYFFATQNRLRRRRRSECGIKSGKKFQPKRMQSILHRSFYGGAGDPFKTVSSEAQKSDSFRRRMQKSSSSTHTAQHVVYGR